MSYRIVEVEQGTPGAASKAVEIGSYDSAYHAVAAMKRAFLLGRTDTAPPNWYLINSVGQILAGPDDILDMDS